MVDIFGLIGERVFWLIRLILILLKLPIMVPLQDGTITGILLLMGMMSLR